MANHKSAKKRIKTSEKKRLVNKSNESRIKTTVKKALAATDKAEAEKMYKEAVSVLDRGVTKGIMHKNTASRKKSSLTRHLNGLSKSASSAE